MPFEDIEGKFDVSINATQRDGDDGSKSHKVVLNRPELWSDIAKTLKSLGIEGTMGLNEGLAGDGNFRGYREDASGRFMYITENELTALSIAEAVKDIGVADLIKVRRADDPNFNDEAGNSYSNTLLDFKTKEEAVRFRDFIHGLDITGPEGVKRTIHEQDGVYTVILAAKDNDVDRFLEGAFATVRGGAAGVGNAGLSDDDSNLAAAIAASLSELSGNDPDLAVASGGGGGAVGVDNAGLSDEEALAAAMKASSMSTGGGRRPAFSVSKATAAHVTTTLSINTSPHNVGNEDGFISGAKSEYTAPLNPGGKICIIDPASAETAMGKVPGAHGSLSGALYEQIKGDDEGADNGYRKVIQSIRSNGQHSVIDYTAREGGHQFGLLSIAGPDGRVVTDEGKFKSQLTNVYADIFEKIADVGDDYEEFRVPPISSSVFSGPHKKDIEKITAEAISGALDRVEKKGVVVPMEKITLCCGNQRFKDKVDSKLSELAGAKAVAKGGGGVATTGVASGSVPKSEASKPSARQVGVNSQGKGGSKSCTTL